VKVKWIIAMMVVLIVMMALYRLYDRWICTRDDKKYRRGKRK